MKLFLMLFTTVILISCNKENKTGAAGESGKTTNTVQTNNSAENEMKNSDTPDSVKKMYGHYTGQFVAVEYDDTSALTYENKITVSIDSVAGDVLHGHSIVAGNDRPFKGNYVYSNGQYSAQASEPGDDKYDGMFSLTIDPAAESVKGTWNSFKKDVYVTKREYDLKKKTFVYDKNNNIPADKDWSILYEQNPKFPDKIELLSSVISNINPSNSLLKKSDIDNLYKGDLEVIRNSIYARHGYSFKNRKMRYFFDNYIDWYMPVSTDVRNELTELEKDNIDLLKRYEEHAEKYYDEYGR